MTLRAIKIPVQGRLSPFVDYFRVVSNVPGGEPYLRLPDGRLELVLRASGTGSPLNVAGTRLKLLRKPSEASPEVIHVRFKPGGAYPFFGVPLSALTDQLVALDTLLGPRASSLHAALDQPTAALRISAIEDALLQRLAAPLFEPASAPMVRRALRLLAASPMLPDVEPLALRLGVSQRHLRRAFAEVVGLTPKQYLRFQRALRAARVQPDASWAQLASSHGYHDQAHLVSEFRALSGSTPGALRRGQHPARALQG